jgi:selenide,water dikinase
MLQLNDCVTAALDALPAGSIRACTDVTGFGLVGHASEMAAASGVTMVLEAGAIPVIAGALDLVTEFLPCGGRANMRHFRALEVSDHVPAARHLIAIDPQTSGGLLMAVEPGLEAGLMELLAGLGSTVAAVGRVDPADSRGIRVRVV